MNSYNLLNSYQISRTNKLSLDEISLRLISPIILGVLNFNWKLFSVSFSLSDFLCVCIIAFLSLLLYISSVQFSLSVVSDSLWPRGLQHARLPCPSPTPEPTQIHVHCIGDAIQSSHPLLSPSPPFPASGSFIHNVVQFSSVQ